jgi:thiosulfate/3-mercaptopyruvate sulfurtransferase
MPLTDVISGGQFLSGESLQSHFSRLKDKEVIVHCGSGVTACHTILALVHAGYPVPALYNGSWSQWCRNH